MLKDFPINIIGGFPVLTENLQWTPDIPLFFSGTYAALEIGPLAMNLKGAMASADRIASHIEEEYGLFEFKQPEKSYLHRNIYDVFSLFDI